MLETIREWITQTLNLPSVVAPSEIGVAEVVDVLIVAVLLYYILRWVRNTRAWSLFKGIVIIATLFELANIFNLITVYWLVESLVKMGLVALVVIFQPELRRALEQIGRGGKYIARNFMRGGEQSALTLLTVNEIVKAAYLMGKVRTGALIVVEQNDVLNEFEHTGVAVDAMVSSQLIINIFEKNTPLHDGAMIIRQNRVASAACVLPLTEEDVSQELGTRHRASIGVSEVSDAMVVVVSEETGAVSVAVGGQLSRNISDVQLREMLLKGDSGAEEKPRAFALFKKKGEETK